MSYRLIIYIFVYSLHYADARYICQFSLLRTWGVRYYNSSKMCAIVIRYMIGHDKHGHRPVTNTGMPSERQWDYLKVCAKHRVITPWLSQDYPVPVTGNISRSEHYPVYGTQHNVDQFVSWPV